MNNRILAALALTTALATGLQAQCQINSGAYVGLSLGGAHLGGKNDFTFHRSDRPDETRSIENKLSATSFAASLFGGYGLKLNSFWVAAELFYQFDNLKSKNTLRIETFAKDKVLTTESNGAFGGAVHLGYIPNGNCLIYAIAGIESRRFKVKFNDEASPDRDISASISKSYTSTAFAPGLGVKVILSKNLAIRTEYKYAMHRKKNFEASARSVIVLGTDDKINVKNSPAIHSFNVGFVYSF